KWAGQDVRRGVSVGVLKERRKVVQRALRLGHGDVFLGQRGDQRRLSIVGGQRQPQLLDGPAVISLFAGDPGGEVMRVGGGGRVIQQVLLGAAHRFLHRRHVHGGPVRSRGSGAGRKQSPHHPKTQSHPQHLASRTGQKLF